ncbi:MAG: hypothetical protein IJ008_05310 [Clostridia bacterium]|nr:hypothetical protein [Clostridia bacterium]
MLAEINNNEVSRFNSIRIYYEIFTNKENVIRQKFEKHMPFYRIVYNKKLVEKEIIYDTEKRLLTSANLVLSKRILPERTYFRILKVSSIKNQIIKNERKTFLGECDKTDEPSNFPNQMADAINKSFKNLFAIDLNEIVKHLAPFISVEVKGDEYKIFCGTGFTARLSFEDHIYKNELNKKKVKSRVCSLKMDDNPLYEEERESLLRAIDKYCKELVPMKRNRFEMAYVKLFPPIPQVEEGKKVEKPSKKDKKKVKPQ